jgi:hypothetical protein
MNSLRIIKILFIIFLFTVCAQFASDSQGAQQRKTLGEIYRSGVINLKPVLKISLDSIPDRIHAKILNHLIQGKDELYVSDTGLNDIKMFNPDGKFIKKFGIKGRGPGDLLGPGLMCFSKEKLVVYEIANRRFSFFTADGKFIKIEKPELKGRLDGMKALDDGRIILEVRRIEANKEKKEIFEWRVLELYSSEMKFLKTVYHQKEHCIKYIDSPKPPWMIALPYRPSLTWDVLPGGKIAAGFPEKYEIKIIDVDTSQMKEFSRDYSPVKVTNADKEALFSSMFHREGGIIKKGAGKFYRDNVEFPEFKPAFKMIVTDKEGHILVFPYSKAGQGKILIYARSFDVFDSKGIFLKHVKIEGNKDLSVFIIFCDSDNEFWCREREDDVETVFVKYKVM